MITEEKRRAAATARAAQVRALADRPSHRRQAEANDSAARVAVKITNLRIVDGATEGKVRFEGYASITEHAYPMWDMFGPYDEIVRTGAFLQTLARVDLDVPLVIGHDQIRRLARTILNDLNLAEDDQGLRVTADLDLADPDVAYIVPKLRAGLIDEMSFAFRIVKGTWSPDWSQFYIDEVDIHRGDVAIVGYGANPFTAGSGLASDQTDEDREPTLASTHKRGVDLISEDDIAPRRA